MQVKRRCRYRRPKCRGCCNMDTETLQPACFAPHPLRLCEILGFYTDYILFTTPVAANRSHKSCLSSQKGRSRRDCPDQPDSLKHIDTSSSQISAHPRHPFHPCSIPVNALRILRLGEKKGRGHFAGVRDCVAALAMTRGRGMFCERKDFTDVVAPGDVDVEGL